MGIIDYCDNCKTYHHDSIYYDHKNNKYLCKKCFNEK